MRIEEIRDLDGPNLFLTQPAIKVELADVDEARAADIMLELSDTVEQLHNLSGQPVPDIVSTRMDRDGHIAVAFGWEHRAFARSLGTWAAQLVIGERSDAEAIIADLQATLEHPDDDDAPLMVHTAEVGVPVISVTGTNGKTTTSRLIAFVLRHAGHKTGLTSSSGVYIDGEQVIAGDYSGPSGGRRVLAEPGLEYAVLETARGGMLLRGCGYDACDVVVVTNVTVDHLGLHGITTVDGLASVKAIVTRIVRPGGFCVLNADNEYTLPMKDGTTGVPVLFSREPKSEAVTSHISTGGKAIIYTESGDITWLDGEASVVVANVRDIPMTFGGRAMHQVENAMAAIAALIGLGISFDDIRIGLEAFRSSPEESKGRLNLFSVNDATVIIDFAHNEAGLVHLLNFARTYVAEGAQLVTIVGTAGDREDEAVAAMAQRATESSDRVVLKDSTRYLRGREPGAMLVPLREGVAAANRPDVGVVEFGDERTATLETVATLKPGDVLAVMCSEYPNELIDDMSRIGTVLA
ncbi:MAG: Mur ligase family protein [Thermomicrobiales bacterium]|nr:Mur ligase family protein [Thermomicrobiales bacterium]MCO5219890.1 Mur ligase family protein [Thermomicrobiales bacterium]MCO5226377.1 Mur ligase family protein [Thermomicrobiales bacterium]